MQQQATDAITASCASWREGNSLNQLDFVGFYFLSNKEGFTQKPYNQLYCVFKASTTVTGLKKGGDGETQETGDEIYYTNYSYSDIMLLSDGICSVDISAGQISSNTIESDYGYRDLITTAYVYKGYTDLDSMSDISTFANKDTVLSKSKYFSIKIFTFVVNATDLLFSLYYNIVTRSIQYKAKNNKYGG